MFIEGHYNLATAVPYSIQRFSVSFSCFCCVRREVVGETLVNGGRDVKI
jgi:hypothetical protein